CARAGADQSRSADRWPGGERGRADPAGAGRAVDAPAPALANGLSTLLAAHRSDFWQRDPDHGAAREAGGGALPGAGDGVGERGVEELQISDFGLRNAD